MQCNALHYITLSKEHAELYRKEKLTSVSNKLRRICLLNPLKK